MRIIIYGINYSPELTGIGKYTGEMSAWLAARGHDVRVITAPPYYPAWVVTDGFSGTRYSKTSSYGALIFRSPLWVPAKPSGVKRIIHLMSFAIASAPLLFMQLSWRPQVLWLVEPPLACAPLALVFSKMSGAKSWLHVQDFEVDAAFNLGVLKSNFLRRSAEWIEKKIMRSFDRVSSISTKMLEKLVDKGVDSRNIFSFPNWVDVSAITPLCKPSSYRARLGIPEEAVVALYSGNMGGKQGLEILADCARLLVDRRDLYFVFCGDGSGRSDLILRCAGLGNVFFLPLQPIEELGDLLGLADVHMLPQRADAADLVMPSKLTGMLASGRAIVATAHAHTELGIIVSEVGVIVPPEDARALADAILLLAGSPDLRREMGQRARSFAEERLDLNAILGRFENELNRIV